MRLLARIGAILGALGLFGCDYGVNDLKPGVSTGYEVRQRLGTPTLEWRNQDGSVTWEFARTPEGRVNYMATIGPDNILREFRQVLTEENFAKVRTGMTRDEVRHLLGRPANVKRFDLSRQEVWDWKIRTPFPNADIYINVHFDESGRVVNTSRSEDHRG